MRCRRLRSLHVVPGVRLLRTGGGISAGALAAAVIVPVAAVLLAGGLALTWIKRRRRRRRAAAHATTPSKLPQADYVEEGQLSTTGGTGDLRVSGVRAACHTLQVNHQAQLKHRLQGRVLGGSRSQHSLLSQQ